MILRTDGIERRKKKMKKKKKKNLTTNLCSWPNGRTWHSK